MTTIIERDVSSDSGISSALTAAVAIIAILFIVGIALYMLRLYPFSAQLSADTITVPSVNVDITRTPPVLSPPGQ